MRITWLKLSGTRSRSSSLQSRLVPNVKQYSSLNTDTGRALMFFCLLMTTVFYIFLISEEEEKSRKQGVFVRLVQSVTQGQKHIRFLL